MPTRVPAAELYRIEESDLRDAIASFREGALPPTFQDSTRFDLLVDGYKRYPPKVIVALAAKRPLGRLLSSKDLTGGESSAAFRLLVDRGFAFATKLASVGALDATFSVGRDKETQFVHIESRGPERNTEYTNGLEALLRGLADLDATLDDVVVDSSDTRSLSMDKRRVALSGYPLQLRAIEDMRALRVEITSKAASTARADGATGSGNSTKRMRLVFTDPDDRELFEIATFLSQGRPDAAPAAPREFVFHAHPPRPRTGVTVRRAMDETDVEHIHDEMRDALYASLIDQHGAQHVSCEEITCSGRPADIVLRLPNSYELFEIKTWRAPRDCVRDALGQLLEYAYWPGSPSYSALWIVGPSPLDEATRRHLAGLHERFNIPIDYRHQPVGAAVS